MKAAWIVFRTELRSLLRDRKALIVGWLLPLAFYPLLFLGSEKLGRSSREALEERVVTIGIADEHLPANLLEELRERLVAEDCELEEVEVPADWEALDEDGRREAVTELCRDELDAVIWAPVAATPPRVEVRGHFAGEAGAEARRRSQRSLRSLEREGHLRRIEEQLGGDPAAGWDPQLHDVSTEEERAGLALGRLLAFLSILTLISGGSFAALDAFSAERERGTLETLLVHPVPPLALAWGKFSLVCLSATLALFGSIASFTASVVLDLGELPGFQGVAAQPPPISSLLLGFVAMLPTAVLVSAALCWTSARARSYREGQHMLFPLTMVALIPAAWSAAPSVELSLASAWIPIAGGALALRDVLRGELALAPLAVVLVSSTVWAALVVAQLGRTLDAERLLASRDTGAEAALRRTSSRRALRWGWVAVAAVFLFGTRIQAWNPLWGLVATLWVLVPALAWLTARDGARLADTAVADELGLRRPHPAHLVAAVAVAPVAAWITSRLVAWQSTVLPVSQEMIESLEAALPDLSFPALFLLIAVSPGITEELLFRGSVLSGLRRDKSALACILWQALLFGAVHLSIHRFLPTALLGGLLAAVTLRARCIWPAIALHVAYNGTVAASTTEGALAATATTLLESSWTPLLAVAAIGFAARRR